MDPLSITASIITALSTGSKLYRALDRLFSLKHALAALLELNDEVNHTRSLIENVDNVLRCHAVECDNYLSSCVMKSLERLKSTLTSMEHLVAYELTVVFGDQQALRVDKSEWIRAEHKIERPKTSV